MQSVRRKEKGAVSIFVVVFAALLITTITVAFVRLMTQNQIQATLNDLSKSALDSAYAGVEDAKRALVTYRKYCMPGGSGVGTQECVDLTRALTGPQRCDTLQEAGIAGSRGDKEVLIKQTEGSDPDPLDQAYTCVKVQLNTEDYVASLTENSSRLIPLKSEDPFNEVEIQWYSQSDIQEARDTTGDISGPIKVNLANDSKLPKLADWPANRPALLRVQLVQFGDSFNLADFDYDEPDATNNATLFLMPSIVGAGTFGNSVVSFGYDIRQSAGSGALQQIPCNPDFSSASTDGQYACKVKIQLPNPINETDGNNRRAYLRVTQIYNPITTVKVSLWDTNDLRQFSAIQPVIDSTGRANDLFRRVRARIEMETSNIPPLESAIDLTGSLCKTFLVTDDESEYNPGSCG